MPSAAVALERAQNTLVAIRREAWNYSMQKPGRVPPADSPNRPHLARLWLFAYGVAMQRRKVRTFNYHGNKYGVVYIDSSLCVMDWATRGILVKPPSSIEALHWMLNPYRY